MAAATSSPLRGLTATVDEADFASRIAGWWLAQLGAGVDALGAQPTPPLHPAVEATLARPPCTDRRGDQHIVIGTSGAADVTVAITTPEGDGGLAGDQILWARSGLADLTHPLAGGHEPCVPSNHQASILAGTAAVIGGLAVAVGQVLGGETAAAVGVDKLETLAFLPMQPISSAQLQTGPASSTGFPGGVFGCKDGEVYVRPVEPAHWALLLGEVEALRDTAAQVSRDAGTLVRERAVIDRELQAWLATESRDELVARMQAMHVPLAPLNDAGQVASDEHLKARSFIESSGGWNTITPPWMVLGQADGPTCPSLGPATSTRPLAGVRVLDLTWAWAGPFATTLLGDLGAEILNLEWHPRASNLRQQAPFGRSTSPENAGGWWSANQRGKRSIGVNLKHPQGRAIVRALASVSHLAFENFSPGVVERLGVAYRDLVEVNPSLVYVSMSAFGRGGPAERWIGYGTQVHAAAGGAMCMPTADGQPSQMFIPYADPVSGFMAALAGLAYLWRSATSGGSCHLDVSELECMACVLLEPLLEAWADGQPTAHPYSWHEGREGWWLRPSGQGAACAQKVATPGSVLDDGYLQARRFWAADQTPALKGEGVRIAGSLWQMDGERSAGERPAPQLFGDTRRVLADVLELEEQEIDHLVEVGAISESVPPGGTDEEGST